MLNNNPCNCCLVKTTCFGTKCNKLDNYFAYIKNNFGPVTVVEWLTNYEIRTSVLQYYNDINRKALK